MSKIPFNSDVVEHGFCDVSSNLFDADASHVVEFVAVSLFAFIALAPGLHWFDLYVSITR